MIFWAIAYKYQEDVFWDFEIEGKAVHLKETGFLPTKTIAESFIENELSDDFIPVEINVERIEKDGCWTISRQPIEQWDELSTEHF